MMSLLDNPFYILRASPSDSRSELQARYDVQSLSAQDPERCEAALSDLLRPTRRIEHELRWLPGCTPSEVDGIMKRIKACTSRGHATLGDITVPSSCATGLSAMNQLISLLPLISDGMVDEAVFLASRLCDEMRAEAVLEQLNCARLAGQFQPIRNPADLDSALTDYRNEIMQRFRDRVNRMGSGDKKILLTRVSGYGTSPIVTALINDYQLSISAKLEQIYKETATEIKGTNCFTVAEFKTHMERIITLTTIWGDLLQPLQLLAKATGSDSDVEEYEKKMFSLLAECFDSVLIRQDWELICSFGTSFEELIPQNHRWEKLKQLIREQINKAGKMRQEEFTRQAQLAWEDEQRKNDETSRKRAADAQAAMEKYYSEKRQKEKEETERIEALQARYKKLKQEEEEKKARAEREKAQKLKAEQERRRTELAERKKMLFLEKASLGLFDRKRKKGINSEIAQIDRELNSMN